MKRRLFSSCALIILLQAHAAFAATCGGVANVIVISSSSVAFSYNANAGAAVSNGTVTASCLVTLNNALPSFTLALSSGNAGSFSPRQMSSLTGGKLNYNIYTGGSYSSVWGDGTGSTSTQAYSAGAGSAAQSFTAFGLAPQSQFVAPGLYSDTVTITVTF